MNKEVGETAMQHSHQLFEPIRSMVWLGMRRQSEYEVWRHQLVDRGQVPTRHNLLKVAHNKALVANSVRHGILSSRIAPGSPARVVGRGLQPRKSRRVLEWLCH